MTRSCATCRYREYAVMEIDGQPVIECHRYPPLTVNDGEGLTRLFPQVNESDWCGEFQPGDRL